MRKETSESLKKYKEAWEESLDPGRLSFIRLIVALSAGPITFTELVQKTGMSSRTLNKRLKNGIRSRLISQEKKRSFPRKTIYSLTDTEGAGFIEVMGRFIQALDEQSRHLIKGAGEQLTSTFVDPPTTEEIVEGCMTLRNDWLEIFLETDPAYLETPEGFWVIQTIFSAINSITFWGAFFALRFPHIKKKAKKNYATERHTSTFRGTTTKKNS